MTEQQQKLGSPGPGKSLDNGQSGNPGFPAQSNSNDRTGAEFSLFLPRASGRSRIASGWWTVDITNPADEF